jgi:hypothetical protein
MKSNIFLNLITLTLCFCTVIQGAERVSSDAPVSTREVVKNVFRVRIHHEPSYNTASVPWSESRLRSLASISIEIDDRNARWLDKAIGLHDMVGNASSTFPIEDFMPRTVIDLLASDGEVLCSLMFDMHGRMMINGQRRMISEESMGRVVSIVRPYYINDLLP